MKLLFENWRTYLNEEEEAEPCDEASDFLWHGSKTSGIEMFEPRQATDVGGNPDQNLKAVYATHDKDFATHMGMTEPDEDGNYDVFGDHEKGQVVIIKGKIRHGQKTYLYKLPKHMFKPVRGNEQEWYSEVGMRPCEVIPLNVDDHLHLVRMATSEDQAYYDANIGKHGDEK